MLSRKIFFVTGVLVLAGSIVPWCWMARSARAAGEELAALDQRRTGVEAQVRQVESAVAEAERTMASLDRALASNPRPAAAAKAPFVPPTNENELISSDPALGAQKLKADLVYVKKQYDRFYRRIGLTSAQVEQFEKTLVEYRQHEMDLYAIGLSQGAAGRRSADTLAAAAREQLKAAQAELLGPEGYRQLEEYERTWSIRRSIIDPLVGTTTLHGAPLTAEQAERLGQAAVRASARDPAATGDKLLRTIDWDEFHAEAQQILTPAQFDLMRNVYMPSGALPLRHYRLEGLIAKALEADALNSPGAIPPRK